MLDGLHVPDSTSNTNVDGMEYLHKKDEGPGFSFKCWSEKKTRLEI